MHYQVYVQKKAGQRAYDRQIRRMYTVGDPWVKARLLYGNYQIVAIDVE